MPRRYHRPPQAKKRKARKTPIPYAFEAPEVAVEAEDGGLPLAETEDEAAEAVGPVRVERPRQASEATPAVAHIARDYSYVKAEVVRILLVAGFLLLGLIITAILRH